MKAKFGAVVVDGRGKLGGHVFSKNRGGAYVRTKVTPINPQSSAQLAVRALFTLLAQGWRSLTEAQRTAWNSAVNSFTSTDIFGDIKKPSGENLYIRLNSNISNGGGAIIDTPPAPSDAPEPIDFSSAPNGTTPALSIVFSPSPVAADMAYIVEATPCVSPGKSFIKNQYRVIKTLAAADATPNNALAAYTAKFGALVTGQKVGIRMKAVNLLTGVTSQVTENVYIVL